MRKIQRHEATLTSSPPTSGPTTVAIPPHAVQVPIAGPRSSAPVLQAAQIGGPFRLLDQDGVVSGIEEVV